MARGPCPFRQCDVARALRAGKAAGVPVEIRIDRRTGDLVIKAVTPDDNTADVSDPVPPEDIVL